MTVTLSSLLAAVISRVVVSWNHTKLRCVNYLRKRLFELVHRDQANYYAYLSSDELRQTKSSDTLFIFGSGFSLNAISAREWQHFESADTLSFNQFIRQDFVNLDYYLIREIGGIDHQNTGLSNRAYDHFRERVRGPRFKETVYLLQKDLLGEVSIEVQHRFLLPKGARIWLYRTFSRKQNALPSNNLDRGVIHTGGTISDAVSWGYGMGYKSIVLVGVDLFDRRYFWLNEDETRVEDTLRAADHTEVHGTAQVVVDLMKRWTEFLKERGVSLTVYNPQSLLAEVMDVYPARGAQPHI